MSRSNYAAVRTDRMVAYARSNACQINAPWGHTGTLVAQRILPTTLIRQPGRQSYQQSDPSYPSSPDSKSFKDFRCPAIRDKK